MSKDRTLQEVKEWTGFIASVVCTMLSGIFLAFNVYAVPLKQHFQMNQTQVELVGSVTFAGMSLMFVGFLIINKFGYTVCYVTSWVLVTSSGLLMWMATLYPDFFRNWIALMCLFQLMGTLGAALVEINCITIGVQRFSPRHIGKVNGVYFASVSFGKIYYSSVYLLFIHSEDHLGQFFLSIPIAFAVPIIMCVFLHNPNQGSSGDENRSLATNEGIQGNNPVDYQSVEGEKSESEATFAVSGKQILQSAFFHLFFWSNGFFNGCTTSFMNNITTVAKAIGLNEPETTVYVLCTGIIVSRIVSGAIFDFFGKKMVGLILLMVCYVTFAVAMAIGLFWLSEQTMYLITVLVSMGVGAGFSLTLTLLSSVYGSKNYPLLISVFDGLASVSTILVQLTIGLTYDRENSDLHQHEEFCAECLRWTYVILSSGSVVAMITGVLSMRRVEEN